MSQFRDVPTDQLLSFQEFTPVHEASFSSAQLNIDISTQEQQKGFDEFTQNNDNIEHKPLDDIDKDNSSMYYLFCLIIFIILF